MILWWFNIISIQELRTPSIPGLQKVVQLYIACYLGNKAISKQLVCPPKNFNKISTGTHEFNVMWLFCSSFASSFVQNARCAFTATHGSADVTICRFSVLDGLHPASRKPTKGIIQPSLLITPNLR